MDSKGATKHKGWWIAGGLTTLFVFSQIGEVDRTRLEPAPANEPVAAYVAPQPETTPTNPAPLPTVDAPPEEAGSAEPVAAPEPEPQQDTASEEEVSYVYYRNCSAARAAGAAPISVGEPGYARKLDRDGDGIACE